MSQYPRPSHRRFRFGPAMLGYARRRSDGGFVCITEVASGLHPDLACPALDCGWPVVARFGEKGRTPHFAHHRGRETSCVAGGETSAHLLAKDILNAAKTIKLPAVTAEYDGATVVVSPERTLAFDRVEVEPHLGDLVPDVVLYLGEKTLLVEVRVTHACDGVKKAKLKARQLASIEVDLRAAQHGGHAAIEQAILRSAPRDWLYNARQEAAVAELRETALAKVRDQARLIVATPAAPRSSPEGRAAVERLRALSADALCGVDTGADRVFAVPREEWQARLSVEWLLEDRSDRYDGGFGLASLAGWAKRMGLVRDGLDPDWSTPLRTAVGEIEPGFVRLRVSLLRYLRGLEETKAVTAIDKTRWSVVYGYRQRLLQQMADARRRQDRWDQIERTVGSLVATLPVDSQIDFSFDAWARSLIPGLGTSLTVLVDRTEWETLRRGLEQIESVLRWGTERSIPTFGLPVCEAMAAAVEARRAREAAAAEAETARLEAEAEARVQAVRRGAERVFGIEAAAGWLSASLVPGGPSMLTLARASASEQGRVWFALEAQRLRLERLGRDASIVTQLRHDLQSAARAAFGEQPGDIWLRTGNPALGSDRPWDHCLSARAQQRCLATLKAQAPRGRTR